MLILIRRFLKYIIAPLFLIAMLWVGYFLLYGNFHKVDNGVYRSAQLFSFNMPYYLEKYHIKSMLNLRGPSDAKWYHDEIDICQEHHVKHYDYGIGDREVSSEKQMDEIIRLIKQAPKPLLIHCKAGADRTSLSSALYLYAIKNDRDASRAISIIYGHFPWFGSRTKAMDKSFKNYVKSHPKVKK